MHFPSVTFLNPQEFFRKEENANLAIFQLCWRDTYCETYVLDEPAPLDMPKKEEDIPAHRALQDKYVARWKPIFEHEYERRWPNVSHYTDISRKIPHLTSPVLHSRANPPRSCWCHGSTKTKEEASCGMIHSPQKNTQKTRLILARVRQEDRV